MRAAITACRSGECPASRSAAITIWARRSIPTTMNRDCTPADEALLRAAVRALFPARRRRRRWALAACMFTNTTDEHFVIDTLPGLPAGGGRLALLGPRLQILQRDRGNPRRSGDDGRKRFRPVTVPAGAASGRVEMRPLAPALALLALAGCAGPSPPPPAPTRAAQQIPSDAHVPDFARVPYEPLSRASVVGDRAARMAPVRAGRGRRSAGQPPATGARPEARALARPVAARRRILVARRGPQRQGGRLDRQARRERVEFPADEDGRYAWSAAFVSYVMRIAGAGPRFPYSPTHSDYIDIAREMSLGQTSGWVITAERPERLCAAPRRSDLHRARTRRRAPLRRPAGRQVSGHCDIVVQAAPGQLVVIGGNVDDAVTMKHVPTTPDGKLAEPDGTVIDTRYPWMVVLRVLYETPVS